MQKFTRLFMTPVRGYLGVYFRDTQQYTGVYRLVKKLPAAIWVAISDANIDELLWLMYIIIKYIDARTNVHHR